MVSTPAQNDPIGRLAVKLALCSLLGLALFASVYQIERPAAAQTDPGYIIQTATPPLPTAIHPALALDLAQPTPAPQLPPPDLATCPACGIAPGQLPPPVWTAADLAGPPVGAIADPGDAPAPEVPSGDYIANVGAQAEHAPRGGEPDPPPSQTGPILMPPADGQPAYIVAPKGSDVQASPAAPGIAAAVPPISAEQSAIIGKRTSNSCAAGQIFMPRTGCYTPGSGGPMPGAVGEP